MNHANDFERDYGELIDSYLKSEIKPKIFICKPVPIFSEKFNKSLKEEILPKIEKISKEKQVELIDLYKPFLQFSHYFPDSVHPDKQGLSKIAGIVYESIKSHL